jgi:Ser/Thr protein kinase RdoA (MazF antagonist)
MKSFEELTREGQVRRIKRLAQEALRHYDLEIVSISPIQHFMNTVFRVEAAPAGEQAEDRDAGPDGSAMAVERFSLRVHRPGTQRPGYLASELVWLRALKRDLGLTVPVPVPARDGSLIVEVEGAGAPGPRPCVLFRWVHGSFRGRSLSAAGLQGVGEFMARLHTYSETFRPPEGFSRPRWDIDGLLGRAAGLDPDKALAAISADQKEIIMRTSEMVRGAMLQLGESPDVFGVIHADLHQGNYLFHKGEVRAIDFDFSGWGHYAYDIGVTFSALQRHPNYPSLREAFLIGYKRRRPLPTEQEALIDTFKAAFIMGHSLWLSALLDEPAFGERAHRLVQQRIGMLATFLASRA